MSEATNVVATAVVSCIAAAFAWAVLNVAYEAGWQQGARQCLEAPALSECKKAVGK